MSEQLRASCPGLPAESVAALTGWERAVSEAKAQLPPGVAPVIDKLVSRKDQRDGDLCEVAPLGLFVLLWDSRDKNNNVIITDVLTDIGGTCLQGDTHRLFALLLAIRRN